MTDGELRALARRYEVHIIPSAHGGYTVSVPAFEPAVVFATGGETPEEALANAFEAIELVIEDRLAEGRSVPEPTPAVA